MQQNGEIQLEMAQLEMLLGNDLESYKRAEKAKNIWKKY